MLDPSHPYTIDVNNERASIIFADGVDYAIEIKSDLSSENEIERALKQIQSIKKLRRVKHGLIFTQKYSTEEIECACTIPGLIVADNTYSNKKTLIEKIYQYYSDNKIPKVEQFDLILVNNDCLIYNFRKGTYVSSNTYEGIAYWEGKEKSLSAFLLKINEMPHCEPQMSSPLLTIYLKEACPTTLKRFPDLDSIYIGEQL